MGPIKIAGERDNKDFKIMLCKSEYGFLTYPVFMVKEQKKKILKKFSNVRNPYNRYVRVYMVSRIHIDLLY